MDLVLRHFESGALIVIENKIYAPDQERQLERYWNWMQSHIKTSPQQSLLYLTINGKDPVKRPPKNVEYKNISYKTEIKSLLDKALPVVKAPIISAIITQYSELISSF